MSQINKLYRNFIILQEDERGHSTTSDKTLSGYSKIEAKGERCKISFYAQNLRKDIDEYNVMLICNKRESKQLIDLGKIVVSDSGKGECTKEYFVDNIAGLDIEFDKICGAAIVKMKDGMPIFIMCGFMNGNQPTDNWKTYKVVKANEEKNISKVSMPKKETPKKDSDKKKDKDKDKIKDKDKDKEKEKCNESEEPKDKKDNKNKKDNDSNKNKKDNDSNKNEKDHDNECDRENYAVKEPIEKVDPRGKFEEYEASIKPDIKNESDVFELRGRVGEYFESIAKGFENCNDKYKEIKNCKWYRVNVNDLYEMCNMSNYNKYTVAYYPMLNYYPYIKKHGKFMLGYKGDRDGNLRYIVYGVPGRKDKDEQPYEGKTGFVTWISDNDKDRDGMGCWLMFYDFKNSTVVVPMQ
ncbi:hypothetical protein [Clostridium sp.]|uniref:hypothetical protein n=1 Tax=Clostridium sp. TaxID=1506 RepID=UPI002FC85594